MLLGVLTPRHSLLVRLIVGPLCDRYGPRYVFIGILLSGSIPTALAGTVTSASGLLALRFFVGILGGSFVPCQVWSTGFYDTKVIGTANGLMAGIGNAGGGITYFVMPAVFDSLVANQGLTPHKAWRVSFVVPFILITATALGMLFLCEDTPTGPWSERHLHAAPNHQADPYETPSSGADGPTTDHVDDKYHSHLDEKKKTLNDTEAGSTDFQTVVTEDSSGGLMFRLRAMSPVVFSLQALMLGAPYACSFGGELAINSILGAYYAKNFPDLGQTKSGQLYVPIRFPARRQYILIPRIEQRCSVFSTSFSDQPVVSSLTSSTATLGPSRPRRSGLCSLE